jgi:two-component system, chemotaxis family, protein-glutamate methylesterase/glutaminase
MLRRSDPPPQSSDEQTEAHERPVRTVIVIGASAGGRAAIGTVLKDLSHDIPAAIVVMLHVAADSDFDLSKWFQQFGHIEIRETRQPERLCEGVVFVAPPGHSVTVHDGQLGLHTLERMTSPRQTINRLFESAATAYGNRVIGVILSGYLADGSQGLRAVHEVGGLTIIQNPEDAEQWDMPANALKQVPEATFRLNGTDIGLTLDLMARRNAELESGLASAVRLLKDRVALLVRLVEQSKGNEATHRYLATELKSLRGELRSVENLLSESQ